MDGADLTLANALYGSSAIPALPAGFISDPTGLIDNPIGYDGYVFSYSIQAYRVRFRHYEPRQGRWLERDPLGYVDGMGLYEYVGSGPAVVADPMLVSGRVVFEFGKHFLKYAGSANVFRSLDNLLEAGENLNSTWPRQNDCPLEAMKPVDDALEQMEDAWQQVLKDVGGFFIGTDAMLGYLGHQIHKRYDREQREFLNEAARFIAEASIVKIMEQNLLDTMDSLGCGDNPAVWMPRRSRYK